MRLEISGGLSIHLKRRKRKREVEEEDLESETEVFRPGFQPNREDDDEEEGEGVY